MPVDAYFILMFTEHEKEINIRYYMKLIIDDFALRNILHLFVQFHIFINENGIVSNTGIMKSKQYLMRI